MRRHRQPWTDTGCVDTAWRILALAAMVFCLLAGAWACLGVDTIHPHPAPVEVP